MSGKAYWVAHVSVTDPAAYQAYRAAAAPAIAAHGGQILVLGGEQDLVAGAMRPATVIVAFPSLEAARSCYHGPDYQATLAMRDAGAEVDLAIVAGTPTSS
ncbi:DUF1330 domain-containing protein [Thioclava atlantica]|uniref:DUF1330 domain-containing protein n=1 Tax=Thioclava atlantica TaxID=1317124 RepID=A0A085U1G6_9RHOB|nr:DUF1330 domain-containing protein [Thioclava atlantica]KFE36813.1 hypothetical protein DW2_01605 [Thioclava atlantica]